MVLAVAARACLLENGRVVLEDRSDRQQAPPLVNEY
jgi:ABC-type branched-subunit amino acid transport system ATPase component